MATSDFLSQEQLQAMMEHRFGVPEGTATSSPLSFQYEQEEYPDPISHSRLYNRQEGMFSPKMQTQDQDAYYDNVLALRKAQNYPMAWDDPYGPLSKPEDRWDPYVQYQAADQPGGDAWQHNYVYDDEHPRLEETTNPMLMEALIRQKQNKPTGVYSGRADENYPNVPLPIDNSMYGGDDDGITRYDFDNNVPQQEDFRFDVGKSFPINANVPKPGPTWGFGIPAALMNVGRRLKGSPYYSEKFPKRTFTEGDQTYTQRGLGGHYTPDELFNMQEFGEVGDGDPRKDPYDKNIVSFADNYEEGLEDWVTKYGDMVYKTPYQQKKQAWKKNALAKIQNRNKRRQVQNQRAHEEQMRRSGMEVGRPGAFEDLSTRDRGGQGAFKEDIAKMRGAARSYRDAKGNVGYSSGRATGGLIRTGYNQGGRVGILSLL